MKRILISSLAILCAGFFGNCVAQVVVTLKQKPVNLIKQGETYVVPANPTYDYYTYSSSGTDFICTASPSTELPGITYTSMNIMMGNTSSTIYCYPSTYFVVP